MHDHAHEHRGSQRRLGIALGITASYMVIEAVGGIVFNSLALLADAGHMLSDAMALGLSWLAIEIGRRSPTDRHTYGFRRTEILAALLNGLTLWAIVGVIFYEAAHRFYNPPQVQGLGMMIVAATGLAINLLMAGLLYRGSRETLNVKGAFLHVISDALGSVGAIVAAAIILFTGFNLVDPLVSVLIGLLILYSSWGLVKESVNILLEGVPAEVDFTQVEKAIVAQNGICCVYDLHVWSITSNRHALSAHVVLSHDAERENVLNKLNSLLKERFQISHTTIQIEITHEIRHENHNSTCRTGTACGFTHESSGRERSRDNGVSPRQATRSSSSSE